jgi:UDP-galactopyranose mutase
VIFAGRLADYKYYNMDQAVGRALKVFEQRVAASSAKRLHLKSVTEVA